MEEDENRPPFLVRYPIADSWLEFAARVAMVLAAIAVVAIAVADGRSVHPVRVQHDTAHDHR